MVIIPIEKEEIPYLFTIEIGGEDFEMQINYNERFDFFTIDLYKDDEVIVLGEKIVLGRALFASYPDESKLPQYPIIPLEEGNNEHRISYENFGVSVFLFVGVPDE